MKKLLIIIGVLLLVGCASKKIDEANQTLRVTGNSINSYTMDLRIYGILSEKRLNEIVKVKRNGNTYEVEIKNNDNIVSGNQNVIYGYGSDSNRNIIYINSEKVYTYNKDINEYVKTDDKLKYSNPSIYLGALDHLKKVYKISEVKIGDQAYKKYDVTVEDKVVADIIKDADLDGIKIDKSTNISVYLDETNKLYKIIYNFKNVTVNVSYFGINEDPAIVLPSGI